MVCSVALNPVLEWDQEEQSLAALVSQIAEGNESSLAKLYDRTSRVVYGLALRILGDATVAEEISLEAYMQVWRSASTYDCGRGSVNAWLVTLVRSRAIDWLRSRRCRGQQSEQSLHEFSGLRDSSPSPETITIESGRARVVQNALSELPADQRRLIELAFFSGYSHSEIARYAQLPLGTVKTRIRLGMGRLREVLGPEGESL
jgi:RNA polymerase sigma-70 factor (ECF subfamily)